MASTEHYYTKLEEGHFYHIYNRTVDKKPMFKSEGNYEFFLKQYDQYLSPVLDTYAYCLLINHFHLLVRISPDLTTFRKLSNLTTDKTTHDIVSHQFRKFFQSYAMAFNKQQERIGTLFQTPFKRALVDNDQYLTYLVYYIHANPQLHGLIDDFRDWKWSSYARILIDKPSKLKKQEVLDWFGNKDGYIKFHSENQKVICHKKYLLEDE
jgi:REP element-mobilizing transposase RayT